jgi:hypothetical protein
MAEMTICPGYPFSWGATGNDVFIGTSSSFALPIHTFRLDAATNNHLFWCPRCEMAQLVHEATPGWMACPSIRYKQEPTPWCTHTNEPQPMIYLGEVGRDRIAATKSDGRVWR